MCEILSVSDRIDASISGFGGGDNITENVLFHTCRESSDHGCALTSLRTTASFK
jgi:hypothetical protein